MEGSSSRNRAGAGAKEDATTVHLQIVAEAVEDRSVIDVKMKLMTPLEKMMRAWCQHQGVPIEAARFELEDGREVKMSDTLTKLGWSAGKGTLTIHALPREGATEAAAAATPQHPSTDGRPPVDSPQNTSRSCSLPAKASPAAAPAAGDEPQIRVEVVAEGTDGRNVLDFKMRVTTPFRKMMWAWCEHHELAMEDVSFELRGHDLRPEDSPADCGWTAEHGTLVINAVPKDVEDTNVPEPKVGELGLADAEASELERVSVQVLAEGKEGTSVVDFRMRPSTTFEKMMRAWCEEQKLPRNIVAFKHKGAEVLPDATPEDYDWGAGKGTFVINAVPRVAASSSSSRVDSYISTAAPADTSPKQQAKRVEALGAADSAAASDAFGRPAEGLSAAAPAESGKINVQIEAESEEGSSTVNVKMSLSTTFRKMMTTWCEHHGMSITDAHFLLDGRRLLPEESPASMGWSASKGTMCLRAIPGSEEEEPAPPTQPSRGTRGGRARGGGRGRGRGARGRGPRGRGANGEGGAEISTSGAEESGSKRKRKVGEASVKEGRTESPKRKASAPPQQAAGAGASSAGSGASAAEEKVRVKVLAAGSRGNAVNTYVMRVVSPFEKMMAAWCKHHGITRQGVSFTLGAVEVKDTDTPGDYGCTPGSAVEQLEIRAVPIQRGGKSGHVQAPASRKKVAAVAAATGASHQKAASVGADEKIHVHVHREGSAVAKYKMLPTTSFLKVMAAWCTQEQVTKDAVRFILGDRHLSSDDTPGKCGWQPSMGILKIRVADREPASTPEANPNRGVKRKERASTSSDSSSSSQGSKARGPPMEGAPAAKEEAARAAQADGPASDLAFRRTQPEPSDSEQEEEEEVEEDDKAMRRADAKQDTQDEKEDAPREVEQAPADILLLHVGRSGLSTVLNLQVTASAALEPMFKRLREDLKADHQEISFKTAEGRQLLGAETPTGLGWKPGAPLVVQACACLPEEGEAATSAADLATVGVVGGKDPTSPAGRKDPAAGKDLAASAGVKHLTLPAGDLVAASAGSREVSAPAAGKDTNKLRGRGRGGRGRRGKAGANLEPPPASGSTDQNVEEGGPAVTARSAAPARARSRTSRQAPPPLNLLPPEPRRAPPKRPRIAFAFFVDARKEASLLSSPELEARPVDLEQALVAEWRQLAPSAQAPFEEDASKDRARYEAERETFRAWRAARGGSAAVAACEGDQAPPRPEAALAATDIGQTVAAAASLEEAACAVEPVRAVDGAKRSADAASSALEDRGVTTRDAPSLPAVLAAPLPAEPTAPLNVELAAAAPKRGRLAFAFFADARRPELLALQPELEGSMIELEQQLTTEWRNLSGDLQAPHEESAARDRRRFEAERATLRKQRAMSPQPTSKLSGTPSTSPRVMSKRARGGRGRGGRSTNCRWKKRPIPSEDGEAVDMSAATPPKN